ncbi:hypothetical protein KQX54_005948 [Cotesia glomerata]|uniref:Uncharacterized protein n=1 Tax=Cotesia glomerata TaxID=32391 RepID=A0AAV7IT28_COTGL|nr:hypothetical protein KQX54_005948 [Cotesia glomerata]
MILDRKQSGNDEAEEMNTRSVGVIDRLVSTAIGDRNSGLWVERIAKGLMWFWNWYCYYFFSIHETSLKITLIHICFAMSEAATGLIVSGCGSLLVG